MKDPRTTSAGVDGAQSNRKARTVRRAVSELVRKGPSRIGLGATFLLAVLAPACSQSFDTRRATPERGTIGEEMYGVICDRIGAQELREDLTGASFHDVCHRGASGEFSDTVDTSGLPTVDRDARNKDGEVVTAEDQRARRDAAVARIEALARRRDDLVRAFDATFPKGESIPIRNLKSRDEKRSCDAHPDESGDMPTEFAAMLGRFTDLYNDGTLPRSTQTLASVVATFQQSEEAQQAWRRLSGRKGYRPVETSFGALRPVMGYPNLRELGDASLRLLSPDSQPYALDPAYDANGQRVPVPGPGYGPLQKMLEIANAELSNAKIDPPSGPITVDLDTRIGRSVISRPRDNLEMLSEILYASDPEFGEGEGGAARAPSYIVKRDARGFAALASPTVGAPFVDADGDGFADVDERGRLLMADGTVAPTPFPESASDGAGRDAFGRPGMNGDLLYGYIDTSQTFAARAITDVRALANPDPGSALMDMVGGLSVALGPRTKQKRDYADGSSVSYDGVPADSPLVDLVYAAGAILGDRHGDTTLALVAQLLQEKPEELARVVGALMESMDIAQAHPEAKIPREATFWDDNIDTMVEIAKEPGLLEDVLRAVADPDTAKLGSGFSKFAKFKDQISYDKNNLNGPSYNVTTRSVGDMRTPVDRDKPITGENRSAMYRFLSLISDTTDVTSCNKAGAKVHAKAFGVNLTLPLSGTYKECEVFKIENLAKFYLDAIAYAADPSPTRGIGRSGEFPPPGTMYLRDGLLRNGVGGLGAANVDLMEESSSITGFWTAGNSKVLAPQPKWLNRLVFFDVKGDNVNTSTKSFIVDLSGEYMGSSVCPERVINDPVPDAPDAAPDGKVRGLRNCAEGQWLQQRGANTIFTWEQFGFYDGIRPLLTAFVKHKREDLFLRLSNAAYKHFGGEDATPQECLTINGKPCARSNGTSYEPLLSEALATDLFPALGELMRTLETLSVTACEETDDSGKCTLEGVQKLNGIDVIAQTTRAIIDPVYAKNVLKLTDRRGNVATVRNDGTPVAQVTPAYLLTNALSAIDLAYDTYEAQHPDETDRRIQWRRGRSKLADVFMGTVGAGSARRFTNPTMTKMAPKIVDLLRAQLNVHCPTSFVPPYDTCTWARDELAKKAGESLGSPITSGAIDVMDVLRKDPNGRRELERMLQYVMDASSKGDALASTLASVNDIIQVLRDEENLVPLFHLLASATRAKVDENGNVVEPSLVDAQLALVSKVGGRYFDAEGDELCSREIDPNAVLSAGLANLVKPIAEGPLAGQTPLDVIIDVIADLNRVDPGLTYGGTLELDDYVHVADNITDFLLNKERGLEQFYEVIRQGTK